MAEGRPPPRAGVPAPDDLPVAPVRAGCAPGELSRGFECSARTIRTRVRQAEREEGRREDGSTSAEGEELRRRLELGAVAARDARTVAVRLSNPCPDQDVFGLLVHRLTAG